MAIWWEGALRVRRGRWRGDCETGKGRYQVKESASWDRMSGGDRMFYRPTRQASLSEWRRQI